MSRITWRTRVAHQIMGHASITTTLDLYGHLYPGDMDRYAGQLATPLNSPIRPESGRRPGRRANR